MNKMKKALKYIAVWFYSAMMGNVIITLITGAFRFATAFIENRSPDLLEWIGMVSICLILGVVGLVYFVIDEE